MTGIPALFTGLCDDAALFPPGNAPLPDAIPAHTRHRTSPYADLVGPFVFPASRVNELTPAELDVSLTLPGGPATLEAALTRIAAVEGVTPVALEIAVPAEQSAADFMTAVQALETLTAGLDVFVEIPRDERRPDVLAALVGTSVSAKFRTGGVVAKAYPDEGELAAAIHTVVATGVPFKATAGLHHAVRNTDPDTGFEQHGFLNVLLATRHALGGGTVTQLAATLAERDGALLAQELGDLSDGVVDAVRSAFRSFGTCSVLEPLEDLVGLQLVPSSVLSTEQGTSA